MHSLVHIPSQEARDGSHVYKLKNLPANWSRQRFPDEPTKKKQLVEKLKSPIERGYLEKGLVKNLTGYLPVPKGDKDIRIVYDATKCGLNERLWAPNFILPTIDTILRAVDFDSWFCDADLGECFLNYPLDMALRPYAGIDCTLAQVDIWKDELAVLKKKYKQRI